MRSILLILGTILFLVNSFVLVGTYLDSNNELELSEIERKKVITTTITYIIISLILISIGLALK